MENNRESVTDHIEQNNVINKTQETTSSSNNQNVKIKESEKKREFESVSVLYTKGN